MGNIYTFADVEAHGAQRWGEGYALGHKDGQSKVFDELEEILSPGNAGFSTFTILSKWIADRRKELDNTD